MGNKPIQREPLKLRRSELEEFSKQSLLLPAVIEKLYLHFYRISRSMTEDGVIDLSEFCFSIQKSEKSLISARIFTMFDSNYDKVINFREFILGISVFSEHKDVLLRENIKVASIRLKDKIEYSMRITDIKRKNRIYIKDVSKILISLIQEKNFFKFTTDQIKEIVRNTFQKEAVQEDEHGKYWDSESYSKMVMKNPQIFKWLAVDFESIKNEVKYQRNLAKCFTT